MGFYRLTYAQESLAKVLLGLGGHISTSTMVGAHASRVNETEIAGYFDTTGRVWGGVDKARVYFVVRFERPFRTLNSWTGNERQCDITQMNGSTEVYTIPGSSFKQSPTSGVEADFGVLKPGEQLLVKTAFSYVSIENARENMDQECPHWDFEQVRTEALSVWNEWLGKIDVKGGTNQQKMKFYTDLWHVLLGRHKIDDIDGSYPDYLKGGTRVGKATRIHTLSPEYKPRMLPKGRMEK